MNTNILFDLTFKQVRIVARKFYFKILGPWDPVVPSLDEQVVISEEGWHHLHHKARSKIEMLTRYFALPKIITLFSDPKVKVIYSVVWKGELKGNKKEAASRLYPRCGGMITPQLPFYEFIITEMKNLSSGKKFECWPSAWD